MVNIFGPTNNYFTYSLKDMAEKYQALQLKYLSLGWFLLKYAERLGWFCLISKIGKKWEKLADCSQLILLLTLDMEENDLDENETDLTESDAECYAEAMADMFLENQEVES